MLVKTVSVSDPPRSQQYRIEKIPIRLVAIPQALPSMEEEGNLDALLHTPLPKPEDQRRQLCQRPAQALLRHKVESADEMRKGLLDPYALNHEAGNLPVV